jgi:hypothetical protein
MKNKISSISFKNQPLAEKEMELAHWTVERSILIKLRQRRMKPDSALKPQELRKAAHLKEASRVLSRLSFPNNDREILTHEKMLKQAFPST